MILSFFSNYLSIHQLPLCEEIIRHIGDDCFFFIATSRIDVDRIEMGFEDMNYTKPYVIRAYEGGESFEIAKKLAADSDVAIIGSAPDLYQEIRIRNNRLTFRYNERLFKKGFIHVLDPRVSLSLFNRFSRHRNKNLFVLCASAYTKVDLSFMGFPKNKCFKWGYFPEIKSYPSYEYLKAKKDGLKRNKVYILWVGRLISWKHPEVAIAVGRYLHKNSIPFTMSIIGDGPMRTMLEQKVNALALTEQIRLLGSQNHAIVLQEMEKADIFLFTSDQNEGWGAVLNEAMNAGCAVVVNNKIGSVPFLIRNGFSGIVYKAGRISRVFEAVSFLISNESARLMMGNEAWNTISKQWNIESAVSHLFMLIDSLFSGHSVVPNEGPCSFA